MISLIIDTSTERGIVAIMKENLPIVSLQLPFGTQNAQHLFPAIQDSLQQAGIFIKDLAFITVGIGPGSYTGIRVGAMVAKTLAYACKLPLIGINTLQGFVPEEDCRFAVMIDAKIAGAYLIIAEKENKKIAYHSEPMVCALDALPSYLEGINTIVTPCSERLSSLLSEHHLKWEEKSPCPIHIATLAFEKRHTKNFSLNSELNLCYLR